MNQCQIVLPSSFARLIGKEIIARPNKNKLQYLCSELERKGIPKYRFEPVDWQNAIIDYGDSLILEELGNPRFLSKIMRDNIVTQLFKFIGSVKTGYLIIQKNQDIQSLKAFFLKNIRNLKKANKIPENEDLEILRGLQTHSSKGRKYIVSHDENFWGYQDIIEKDLQIIVIKEWECHKL